MHGKFPRITYKVLRMELLLVQESLPINIQEGDHYPPAEGYGKTYKFARSFIGPFQMGVLSSGIDLVQVTKPKLIVNESTGLSLTSQ